MRTTPSKTTRSRKLDLNKETVKRLSARNLNQVQGGASLPINSCGIGGCNTDSARPCAY